MERLVAHIVIATHLDLKLLMRAAPDLAGEAVHKVEAKDLERFMIILIGKSIMTTGIMTRKMMMIGKRMMDTTGIMTRKMMMIGKRMMDTTGP